MNHRTLVALLLALALLPACQSTNPSGGDGGIDGGSDTDTDADSDVDSDTDTDTGTGPDLSWDGGPFTPCEGEPEEGEVCIKGGTYLMGCMEYDTYCDSSEYPMAEVTLSPFFMESFEATVEEVIEFINTIDEGYEKFEHEVTTEEPGYLPIWSANTAPYGPPVGLDDAGVYEWGVDHVNACGEHWVNAAAGGFSWLGAKRYCEWKGKRLPTEAEWEAAARGQTKNIFPCAWQHAACWYGMYDCCYAGEECFPFCENCCIPFREDEIANCYSPDGARGMYGNAAEWVLDWMGDDSDHSNCAEGCNDPAPGEGPRPILKGGSVMLEYEYTRISARLDSYDPEGAQAYSGVRCVRSPVSFDEPDAGK